MGYDFTQADVAFLTSDAGRAALADAHSRDLNQKSMITDIARLKQRYPEHGAAVAETESVRRRLRGRLADADLLLATADAAQQATATVVAAARARRLAQAYPNARVHDITCSIGAELIELQRLSGSGSGRFAQVIGSDLDAVRLAMARTNLAATAGADTHVDGEPLLVRADACTVTSRADVILADPGRRQGGRRTFGIHDVQPPLLDLLDVHSGRPMVVKCAPGIDYAALRADHGFAGEVVVTSVDGSVKEAALWTDPQSPDVTRTAVVLASDGTGFEIDDSEPDDIPDSSPGTFLIDPDGAVVRAGLVRQYAHRHSLWQLDPQIAYLTGDQIPAGQRGWPIVDRVKLSDKDIRKVLRQHDCGTLEILVRGVDVDPDALRKRLRMRGERPMALVITRIGRNAVVFVCDQAIRAIGASGTGSVAGAQ